MKKVIFTFLILTVFLNLSAQQVDRQAVLVEISTGTWCQYCPGSAKGADELFENGDPVAIIENHDGDDYTNAGSIARNTYNEINGYPTAVFDGPDRFVGGGSTWYSLYDDYLELVDERMQTKSSFTIDIWGDSTSINSYEIVIRSYQVAAYSGSNLKVRFVLTESHIPDNWINPDWGMTEVNFVNRIMLPSAAGTTVTFDEENETDVNLTLNMNSVWVRENCQLVAFLQDDLTKENLQATVIDLYDLTPAPPTFQAGFYAEETGYCDTPGVAYFHSDCVGEPNSWNWNFEGGIPETSLEQNPVITYLDEGSYNVRLIISDGFEKDTLFMEDYIQVASMPDVSWNDVPELCNEDWAPYELTEGQPSGGVYSGEHVIEGKYFNPQGLDAGQYPVSYTYTNEAGCEDSEDYKIVVANCVGIGEKEAISMEVYPNPTTGLLHLTLNAEQFQNADITVIDAVGKEVYRTGGLNVNGTLRTSIDLSSQPQGIYFVTVKGQNQRISQKVFVRH